MWVKRSVGVTPKVNLMYMMYVMEANKPLNKKINILNNANASLSAETNPKTAHSGFETRTDVTRSTKEGYQGKTLIQLLAQTFHRHPNSG